MRFFITAARGLEQVLYQELEGIGIANATQRTGGVDFDGTLRDAYRVCLWSRVGGRVLLELAALPIDSADALYQQARTIAWEAHLDGRSTFAVSASGRAPGIDNSHFGALRVKDAVVDQLRERTGQRPSVDAEHPDLRLHVHLERDGGARISLDLSGASLHRRGYRVDGTEAPLKENLAAALLLLAEWPARCAQRHPLLDPMCGSGTLPIEAALIAADVAPGLLRDGFGFERWRGHDPGTWRVLLAEARTRDLRQDPAPLPSIIGYDERADAVRTALRNRQAAGLERRVHFERRALADCVVPAGASIGQLIVNPPYGERLGQEPALRALYAQLGRVLKRRFCGWTAHLLSGNAELARCVGLRADRRHAVFNGPIECRLLRYPIAAAEPPAAGAGPEDAGAASLARPESQMFADRLRKNLKQLRRWRDRNDVRCFRVYDADIPQYAAAIDVYEQSVHLQEYAPPSGVDARVAAERLYDMVLATATVLGVDPQRVFVKQRRRQTGGAQYDRLDEAATWQVIHEGPHRFWVNLTQYLDTGIFLDQRETRALLQREAAGRDFLNLFCYTATATVYAAAGGARSTTSVDLSATYLDWARRNFELANLGGVKHRLERADCLRWMAAETRRYGLIFAAPPTFSRSKRMERTLDLQRDHVELLRSTARLLTPDGLLVFASDRRGFELDRAALGQLVCEDRSRQLASPDFARSAAKHRVWLLRRAPAAS